MKYGLLFVLVVFLALPAPLPPKPYDAAAAYDVYSALLPGGEVSIRVETLALPESGPSGKAELSTEQLGGAIDSAVADYFKRNTDVLKLQRKFDIPHYNLFTKAEEQSLSGGTAACLAFYQKHPTPWIELSAVGFSGDETTAVVYFTETNLGHPICDSNSGWFERGGHRVFHKVEGKWRVSAVLSDWST